MPWTIRHLTEQDDTSSFNCGEDALDATLDDYIKNRALQARIANATVTWVVVDGSRVVGYYSSVYGEVSQEKAPKKAKGATHPYPVPVLLIARLASDKQYKGQGIGPALVLHALAEAVAASERAGLRMVVVDALKPEVMGFYAKFGFKPYSDLSMYILTKDVKKTLGLG